RACITADGGKAMYGNFELRRDGKFERFQELPVTEGPTYFRLERHGGKVLASASPDGVRWTTLPPLEVNLPDKVRVGVVAGHNTSKGYTAEFSDFKLLR